MSSGEQWRLASIIEGARVGTWEWNVQTGDLTINGMWAQLVGYAVADLEPISVGTWERLTHPDDLQRSNEQLALHFNGTLPWYDCECRMRHRDGRWVWVHDRGKVITQTPDGRPLMMFGTHTDITERKQAEETLYRNEAKYRALFDQSLLGIYLHDMDGRIVDVNEMACRQSGYTRDELLRRTVFDNLPDAAEARQMPQEEILRVWRTWPSGQRILMEVVHRRKDGSDYPVEISTGVVHYNNEKYILAIVQDITERRKAEESFVNIQRLEAIGMLAGGIAHDFNNLLAGILGNIQLAAARTSEEKVSLYLSRALGAMDRARSLTRQLLTFSKGGEPEKEAQPLFPFVEETARFALSGSDISCRVDAAADLWLSEFDRNQLGQVIDNIVINARQAMESGGTLEISAVNVAATDNPADNPVEGVLSGNGVRISIRDTGCGMSKETLARVFEPFFTTRETGHGLGLATSFSIMRRHEGHISVESEPGVGTTVHLYLPAAMGTVRAMSEPPVVERGSGLVLIMDDDADVRDVLAGMLAQLGYGCIVTRDGDEAVAAFRSALASGRPPDAVLLDMTVSGGTGGRGAISPIRSLSPSTPVFVCSGYAEDPAIADPVSAGFNGSLRKPFRLEELARLLGHSGSR